MTKEQIQIESWLSEYLILEKRIDALYEQAQKPGMLGMFIKMGPKSTANMAVQTDAIHVDGGFPPLPWAINLETVYAKVKELSDDISEKIMACVAQMADIKCAVDRAGLTHEEYLYVEQRYFLGMSVKEMERDGCKRTRLGDVKESALQKIYQARYKKAETA